ncbi:MAG: RHS repeat protein, partial [Candidatus Rokubacteria bacterium]|nr:RHS repeat protein [Candidatus Rokubacteria bacterium]
MFTRALLVAPALLVGAGPAAADIVYLYDELNRLVRVIREDGEAASYHYDPVGNILQITRESGVGQTTAIASLSRTSAGQGATVPVTIAGTNLIGATVVCTSPGVTAQNVRTDFDQITLELAIAPTAPLGPAACEVRGLTVAALPFSVAGPPAPAFRASAAVSVARGAPAPSVDRTLVSALSVAVGAAGTTFAASAALAVTRAPAITAVTPAAAPAGTATLLVTLTGAGFSGATAVDVLRNNAADPTVTVMSLTVDGAGTSATVELSIATSAPPGARVLRLTTPAGASTAQGTGGNL